MSEIGGRLGCARCSYPKLHDAHVSIDPAVRICPEYVKPERKKRREQMAAKSDKRIAYLEESDYAARSAAARGKPCEVASPVCTKRAEGLHHVLSRGAAGGLEAAERLGPEPIPSCAACNEHVEREGRAWAVERGLRMTLKDVTPPHLTTSGGNEQEVRMHRAKAKHGVHVHAVLQYRDIEEREWSSAAQTVCGRRNFWLGGALGGWCDVCWSAWRANG